MTWMLILFSFLHAGPGLDKPTKVRVPVEKPFTSLDDCQKELRRAAEEAKAMKQKQIGGWCERRQG